MLKVYTGPTSNGQKVHIMLEECGRLAGRGWHAVSVNTGRGYQSDPPFLGISPNKKIPVSVDFGDPDSQPISWFESGAVQW